MHCTNCGVQLPDDARFCKECGKPTDLASQPGATPAFAPTSPVLAPAPLPTPVKKGMNCFTIGCLGIIVIVVVWFAFFFSKLGQIQQQGGHLAPNPATNVSACTPAQFTLSKIQTSEDSGYIHLTGIATNNCSVAAGVQIKWTLYDAHGNVIADQEFWPASTNNIPPHTQYPFEYMQSAESYMTRYGVMPISVQRW